MVPSLQTLPDARKHGLSLSLLPSRISVLTFHVQDKNEYTRNFADSNATYYNDDKIDITITSIILFLGLVMLLVPSWWLNLAESHTTRLAIITVFIATFLGLLLLVTPSKPFETMAGTAAYVFHKTSLFAENS